MTQAHHHLVVGAGLIGAALARRLLNVRATPWDEALKRTMQAYLDRKGA